MARDVSLRDVAEAAGVSLATASNAINRPERVSAGTVERVRTVVASLKYVPNSAARQLRAGSSDVIGMVVTNTANPFFADVILGAEWAAEELGYTIVVGNSFDSDARQDRFINLFNRQRLPLLIAPIHGPLPDLSMYLRRGHPVVVVDRHADDFSFVGVDDVLGGRLAAQHLIDSGAQRVCFIGGPFDVPQMRLRLDGFMDVARHSSTPVEVMETPTLSTALGRELGSRIAARPPDELPSAIFCANDVLALGLLHSLMNAGVNVPNDVMVMGYDDIDFASVSIVPLTTIRQPAREIGRRSVTLLLSEMGDGRPRSSVRLKPELVVRRSTTGVDGP